MRYECISKKQREEFMPRAWLRKLRMPRSRASERKPGGRPRRSGCVRQEAGRSGCGWPAVRATARTSEPPLAFILQPAPQAVPGGWTACWSAVRPTRATHIRTKTSAAAPALLGFMIAPFMMQARNYLGPPLLRLMWRRGPRVYGCSWCSHLQVHLVRTVALAIHP